ncbi:helix-turn-helix domain-containing protein [Sphaerisporangium corydalis]|uniref:Helix-turn-helix domain-containing protein n=1 Tax=Sphaerisporangium corydalis TaxID=1441875 RepID=A0ABV9ECP4_9ACTN|nr:helix-turn-helix transcriptional regulator [Sphaerisporangium corydalis]
MRGETSGPEGRDESIGFRIARERKLRGLTQTRLAELVPCSKSLIAQVERGHKPATPALVAGVARALRTAPGTLTGQPYEETGRHQGRIHAAVPEVRRALLTWDLPDEEMPVRPVERLRADVAHASALGRQARYAQLGEMLPALLDELTRAARSADGSRRNELYALLSEAYTGATAIAYALGLLDLRGLAMERVAWAASESQDPLRVARTQWQRATLFLNTASYDKGLVLLERIRREIGDDPSRLSPAEISMYGAAHLRSAVFAARAANRPTALEHIEYAREAARYLGGDANHYGLEFGPSNVIMHHVAVAVELCDGTEAVRLAGQEPLPPSVAPVRLGHHYIDLARGWLYHGDRRKSFATLLDARRVAPQQTRNHPMVRETIRMLVQLDRRCSKPLSTFATWLGMH